MRESITLRNGVVVTGWLVRQYGAFEGGMRYIFRTTNHGEVRCIKDEDGNYIEYVA